MVFGGLENHLLTPHAVFIHAVVSFFVILLSLAAIPSMPQYTFVQGASSLQVELWCPTASGPTSTSSDTGREMPRKVQLS